MTTSPIPLERIVDNPYQTREAYDQDAIDELAADIALHGLLQAPVGRLALPGGPIDFGVSADALAELGKRPDAVVQLAFGHRRLRAFRKLAADGQGVYAWLPIELRPLSDEDMALFAWSENAKRQDVNPLDQARAIRRMIDTFGWTQEVCAGHLGMSRSALTNRLRLLNLPDDLQQRVVDGEISERQASAVLPALALPAETQKHIPAWLKNQLQDDIKSGVSSDELRKTAERVVDVATVDLNTAQFPLDQIVPADVDAAQRHHVYNSVCYTCALRLPNNRCGDKTCFNAKSSLWADEQIAGAARQVGIQLLPSATYQQHRYDGHLMHEFYASDPAAIKFAADSHCPNLHLVPSDRSYQPHPEGHEELTYVCYRNGKGGPCMCQKHIKDQAAAAEAAAGQQRREQVAAIDREVRELLIGAIDAGELGGLRALAWAVMPSYSDGRAKVLEITTRRGLIATLAGRIISDMPSPLNDPAEHRKRRAAKLAEFGLTLAGGADDTPLVDVKRRWERLRSWIDRLPREQPTLEAVRGNIQNLLKIEQDLLPLIDEADRQSGAAMSELSERSPEARLYMEIARAVDRLAAIEAVLKPGPIPAGTFEDVSWLVHVPTGDVNFKANLARATVASVRYALALVPDGDGQQGRVEALARALRRLEKEASS